MDYVLKIKCWPESKIDILTMLRPLKYFIPKVLFIVGSFDLVIYFYSEFFFSNSFYCGIHVFEKYF